MSAICTETSKKLYSAAAEKCEPSGLVLLPGKSPAAVNTGDSESPGCGQGMPAAEQTPRFTKPAEGSAEAAKKWLKGKELAFIWTFECF